MGFRPRKLSLTLLQAIAQRVSSAKIYIDSKIYSSIGKGVLAYVCFEKDDSEEAIEKFMSNGYKFIGGISKDFDSNKNLETYFGFGYENCCLAFKLYTSDKRLSKYNLLDFHAMQPHDADWNKMIEIENKSRINFEFELKGLTGSNKRLNSFFSNVFLNL